MFSDVEASMLWHHTKDPIRGFRFSKIPNNLRCEDCGSIDPKSVSCSFPIQALRNWSYKKVFMFLVPALIILILACIIVRYF